MSCSAPEIFSLPFTHVSLYQRGERQKKTTTKKHCASSATGPKPTVWKSDPIKFSSKQASRVFFFFFSPDGTDRRADRSLCRIFWCSRVASRPLPLLLGDTESKGCKSTHFLPPLPSPPLVSLPHLQTQIAAGQSQAFLYAEPVTGVTHHSPRVPSLTSCKARPRSAACMELCDWFATVITIRATVAPAASSLFRARRSPTPPPAASLSLRTLTFLSRCECRPARRVRVCVRAVVNCWLRAYYFKMSPAPALIPVFFGEG